MGGVAKAGALSLSLLLMLASLLLLLAAAALLLSFPRPGALLGLRSWLLCDQAGSMFNERAVEAVGEVPSWLGRLEGMHCRLEKACRQMRLVVGGRASTRSNFCRWGTILLVPDILEKRQQRECNCHCVE